MVWEAEMPWIEATLRGQRVLARANPDGSLRAEDGRVEIRYGPNDGRMYRAAAGNLTVVDGSKVMAEDACGPAAPVSKPVHTGKSEPTVGAADAWIAYTDGACSGNPGPAGCGVVLVSPNGKTHEGLEYLGQATNNVAELTAILRALEWIPKSARSIVVHTDSQYAIGVLQKGWKAKANQDLVSRAKDMVKARHARLVYVPGHQGVALNERADALAREAVERRHSRRASEEDGR
ncbi:MAG TPA: ribonuclease H [Polyangiaceae bacterium]|nr:ribonuclease H [Polyangiaceae bacterium]